MVQGAGVLLQQIQRRCSSSILLVFLLPILVTWPVLKKARNWCYAYYDLGIYGDALRRLSLATPNPWLDARQIHIFNDHFDPILWFAKPLVAAGLEAHLAGIVIESLIAILSVTPVFYMCIKSQISSRSASILVALVLFNTGVTEALMFPIHPTTWAMAPFFWLMISLHFQRYFWSFSCVILLCACKEEFPFAGLMVSCTLLLRKEFKWASLVALASVLWLVVVFWLRPYLDPDTSKYGSVLFQGLVEEPVSFIRQRLSAHGMWSRLGSFAITFAPTLLWANKQKLKFNWPLALPLVPVLAIRILGMSWRAHYCACLTTAFVGLLLPFFLQRSPPRWVYISTLLLLITTNQNKLGFSLGILTDKFKRDSYCQSNSQRLKEIEQGAAYLAKREPGTVLASQNLVLSIESSSGIFGLGGPQRKSVEPYAYVFFEKPPHGVAWPYDQVAVSDAIATWRSAPGTEIVYESDWIFLARGVFVDPTDSGKFKPL